MEFFFFGGGVKTPLEESLDHVIYMDYIVNRRFFVYCSLARLQPRVLDYGTVSLSTTLTIRGESLRR